MTRDPADHANYRHFPQSAGGAAHTRAGRDALWEVVSSIGGDNRYFTLNGLWALREWIDAAIGGEGRIRRHPGHSALRPGDRIDSWKVLVADPGATLALVFGMKAPGRGVLEFRIIPVNGGHRLEATAWWQGEGLSGQIYWRSMQPAHLVLFRRLTAEICRRAEALETAGAGASAHGTPRKPPAAAPRRAQPAIHHPAQNSAV